MLHLKLQLFYNPYIVVNAHKPVNGEEEWHIISGQVDGAQYNQNEEEGRTGYTGTCNAGSGGSYAVASMVQREGYVHRMVQQNKNYSRS